MATDQQSLKEKLTNELHHLIQAGRSNSKEYEAISRKLYAIPRQTRSPWESITVVAAGVVPPGPKRSSAKMTEEVDGDDDDDDDEDEEEEDEEEEDEEEEDEEEEEDSPAASECSEDNNCED